MKTSLFVFALFLMVLVGCEPTSINESFLQQSTLAEEDENLTKDSSEVEVDERETDDVKEKSSSSSSENVPKVVYDSKEDLPECTESLDRQLKIVEENEHAYVCSSEEWVDLGSVYNSELELPRCNENREGKKAFIDPTSTQLVCNEGDWKPVNGGVVKKDEIVEGPDNPYYSSSSAFCWDCAEFTESSSSVKQSSAAIAVSPSSSSKKVESHFDCSVYDCVTTESLNQKMLAAGTYGEYLDIRDYQVYRTIKIGSQTWFAQNLNYVTVGSECYDDDPANCVTYGRLYWQSDAQSACPSGWHLPSKAEWNALNEYVDDINGSESVGTSLKALNVWEATSSVDGGTDLVGFSGLAGAYSGSISICGGTRNHGLFWTADENTYRCLLCDNTTLYEYTDYYYGASSSKMSVRCIKDEN